MTMPTHLVEIFRQDSEGKDDGSNASDQAEGGDGDAEGSDGRTFGSEAEKGDGSDDVKESSAWTGDEGQAPREDPEVEHVTAAGPEDAQGPGGNPEEDQKSDEDAEGHQESDADEEAYKGNDDVGEDYGSDSDGEEDEGVEDFQDEHLGSDGSEEEDDEGRDDDESDEDGFDVDVGRAQDTSGYEVVFDKNGEATAQLIAAYERLKSDADTEHQRSDQSASERVPEPSLQTAAACCPACMGTCRDGLPAPTCVSVAAACLW